MQAIADSNQIAVDGKVGHDGYSQRAMALLQKEFQRPVGMVFAYNGTAANVLALKHMLRPWDAILGASCTHVNTHENGATEFSLGCKILPVPSDDGKVTPGDVQQHVSLYAGYAYKPRVLVLTQPTELGVLYTVDELHELCTVAHQHDMLVFIDGARITHALAALETDLHTMIEETGVDAFTYGGTKAGLMFGEIAVFLRRDLCDGLERSQKQSQQHMDKSKFLGVQFEYLLSTGLWRKTASHANSMAKRLSQELTRRGIELCYPVDTNMVFAKLSQEQLARVQTQFDLHYWDEAIGSVRFAATHETTDEMIDALLALL